VRLAKPSYHDAIKRAWQSDTIPPWHLCDTMADALLVMQRFLEDRATWEQSAIAHYRWHREHFKPAEMVERLFLQPGNIT